LLLAQRERAAQRRAPDLLGQRVLVGARHRTEHHTAARPLRRARAALARAAGALLPPRLRAAARNRVAILGAVRARMARGELPAHLGVEEVGLDLDLEHRGRELYLARARILDCHDVDGGHASTLPDLCSPPDGLRSASPRCALLELDLHVDPGC